jgi:hypothetical protein
MGWRVQVLFWLPERAVLQVLRGALSVGAAQFDHEVVGQIL